ncbi:calcium-binding protein [Bradyrhizobium sp. 5.13L]
MITVQALKPKAPPSQSRKEDYVEKEPEKKGILPIAFLLLLTACATYLKTFLPTTVEAHEDRQNDRDDGADEESDAPATEASAADEEDATTDTTERTAKSSDNVVPIRIVLPQEISEFLANDSPALDFNGLERPGQVRVDSGPLGDSIRATNDNRPQSTSADGAGASGGGGGGGGGGGDDKPRGPSPLNPRPDPDLDIDPHRNRAPRISGPVHLRNVIGCEALTISLLALLSGATDPDGDTMRIVNLSASSGAITQAQDGSWVFARDEGMLGEVMLTYTITDGFASVVQTAYFSVIEAPPIIGTAADDNLLGTQCADRIDGRDGDDNIDARQGNDTIVAGLGDDHIVAGSGNDIVYAGEGNDLVFAGAGNDLVFGGAGHDSLHGEDGDDTIMGEDGDDVISGGGGADILIGGAGDDIIQGDAGNDTLDGGSGNDSLAGGVGDDVIIAAGGDDSLFGGAGNDMLADGLGSDRAQGDAGDDHFLVAADEANDAYDGGDGLDTIDFSAATESVVVNLGSGTAEGRETGHDMVADVERIIGGSGDDHVDAGSMTADVTMSGGNGNDLLEGGVGDDTVFDGSGSDAVSAGGGNDHVVADADAANDSYDGGTGEDTLDYSTATLSVTVDVAGGTADGLDVGHDLIAAFEKIITGSGDDHIVAGSNSISMTGGDGDDTFEFKRTGEDDQAMTIRKITDFTVGDRIVAATYEISVLREDDLDETISDMFDDVYLSTTGDQRPVRFRFEEADSNKMTLVDVHDRPGTDEFFTIQVEGHHQLQFTVAVS